VCRYFHCKYDFQLRIYLPENLGRFIWHFYFLTFWRAEAISLFSKFEKLQYTFKSKSLSLVLTGPKAGGALEIRPHLPEAQSERFFLIIIGSLNLFNPLNLDTCTCKLQLDRRHSSTSLTLHDCTLYRLNVIGADKLAVSSWITEQLLKSSSSSTRKSILVPAEAGLDERVKPP